MASGTISLGTSGKLKGRITWSSVSNGVNANSSTVTATIQASRTDAYGPTYGTWTGNLNIGGTNKTFSVYKSINDSWVTLLSFSITKAHNNDGTGSCAISGKINGPSGTSMAGISVSGSQTVTLDKIPRYATINQSLSSKTETTIAIKWSSDSTCDYLWYSTNNGSSWTGINIADGKSGTYTISSLAANTTYNIKTRIRRKDSQLTTDSSSLSVTTYNWPYCNSMPSLTIGNKLTLGFYNPLSRSITVNILGQDNSQISNDTTTSTSISGYNNSTVQSRFYASIPNAKQGTYKVKVTYGSQVSTKTGGTYSINTTACTPTISSLTYLDTNSTTTTLTGNNQQIIRNQSTVRYTASGLSVKNSATISSVKLSVNSINYNLSVSGTTATGGNAAIDSASNVTATVTLTDSRGLTAKKSVTVTMLDWVLPTAIITLQRQNNFYSETSINVNASYSSIAGKNTITIQYRYKKTTASSYSGYLTLQDNVTATNTFDNNFDWNIQVKLTDKFGSTTYNLILAKGTPIVFFDRLLSSTGFNCFPVNEKSVEINGLDILNALFYKANDTLTIKGATVAGMISGGAEDINFSIVVPKLMTNVTPSITTMKINIRHCQGGYTLTNSYVSGGYDVLNDSTLTVTCSKVTDNLLRVVITKSSPFSVTNNTPQAVTLDNVVLSFT